MAYDIKKTGKKVLVQAIIVVLAGLASVYGNNVYYLAVAPVLSGLLNLVKHWSD